MIKADWDNKDYIRGYRNGFIPGAHSCQRHKDLGIVN